MDYEILSWVSKTFGSSKFFAVLSSILSFIGDKYFVIGFVVLLLCFKKTRKVGFYVMIAGGIAVFINNCLIKNIVKRDRPFISHPELANMCELAGIDLPDEYSMASGHSVTSMAVAIAIMFFSKRWGILAIIVSVLIGLSRIGLCVHYPTDVFVGWVLGAVIAIGLHFLTNYGVKLFNSKRGNKNEKNSISNEKSEQN